jgi:hypothetical protein
MVSLLSDELKAESSRLKDEDYEAGRLESWKVWETFEPSSFSFLASCP